MLKYKWMRIRHTTYFAGVLSSAAPGRPKAGLKLLPFAAAVVDGGGVRINKRWGLSLTGSSSAAAGDPDLVPSAAAAAGLPVRLYGEDTPPPPPPPPPAVAAVGPERLLPRLYALVPRPNLGVDVRSVSRGDGRMEVTAARTGRWVMPTCVTL